MRASCIYFLHASCIHCFQQVEPKKTAFVFIAIILIGSSHISEYSSAAMSESTKPGKFCGEALL